MSSLHLPTTSAEGSSLIWRYEKLFSQMVLLNLVSHTCLIKKFLARPTLEFRSSSDILYITALQYKIFEIVQKQL